MTCLKFPQDETGLNGFAKANLVSNQEPLVGRIEKLDEWLELVASLHYLKHIGYWSGKNKPEFEEVFQKLGESKPHFKGKKELAEVAWERLDHAGLVSNKTLE